MPTSFRLRAGLLTVLIASLWALGFGRAEAGVCPAARKPVELTVVAMLPPPPEDHTTPYAELTKEMDRKMKPDEDAMGVSSSRLGWDGHADFTTLTRAGHNCVYLAALHVDFGYRDRLVQIAREIPTGSCMYKEVREHEYKHVAVDGAVVRDNLALVTARLQNLVDSYGPVEASDVKAAQKMLDAAMKSALDPVIEHIAKLRNAAQARVDTDAEYERVADACRIHVDPTKTIASPDPSPPPAPAWHPDGK